MQASLLDTSRRLVSWRDRTRRQMARSCIATLATLSLATGTGLGFEIFTSPVVPAAAATGATCSTTTLAAGLWHTLAIQYNGTLSAWGDNNDSELGTGSATFGSSSPVLVSGFPTGVASVSGGYAHSLAVTVDGAVWAWGSNAFGELGNGPYSSGSTPTLVSGLSGASAVAGAFWHSLAIASGTVYWWGEIDRNGGVYAAARSWTPTAVPPASPAVAGAGSEGLSMARLSD